MLQEQPASAWSNHPLVSPILLLVGGDAATAMWEEPASNLTFILKQNLSLGEVILQKRKDKQKLPCRFSALTVLTWQLQKCEWDLLCGFTQDTYLQAQSFELALDCSWGCLCSLLPFMQLIVYRRVLMATFYFLLPLVNTR